jgi:hypothetical protein
MLECPLKNKSALTQVVSMYLLMSLDLTVVSQYPIHFPQVLPDHLREVLVPLYAPHGVAEHLKDVQPQFLFCI